jgi:hypothetical protein
MRSVSHAARTEDTRNTKFQGQTICERHQFQRPRTWRGDNTETGINLLGTEVLHLIQTNHQPDATVFSVYYPDVCLQLNMFRAFSRPLSGAQWLQLQPLVLPSNRGDIRAVFVVGL